MRVYPVSQAAAGSGINSRMDLSNIKKTKATLIATQAIGGDTAIKAAEDGGGASPRTHGRA